MRKISAVYHFASSGGTDLSRLLLSRFKAVLLSEVHPYHFQEATFAPSRPIELAAGQVPLTRRDTERRFLSELALVQRRMERGHRLVLRVHSHSDYFHEGLPHSDELLAPLIDKRIVTVREPLTNYLSARERGFLSAMGFAEFADRYHQFLDRYSSVSVMQVESVAVFPDRHLPGMGRTLGLTTRETPVPIVEVPMIAGDSRRTIIPTGEAAHRAISLRWETLRATPAFSEVVDTATTDILSLRHRLGYSQDLTSPI